MDGAESRILDLMQFHDDREDCRILVECERYEMDYLLTYDRDFIKRLAPQAQALKVVRPSEFWDKLNVPPGANPRYVPADGNPMGAALWWRV